jgi:hypothetical protein
MEIEVEMHFLVINKSRYNLVLMTRFLNNLQKIVSWTGIEMRGSFSNYGTSCAIKSMKLYFGFFKVLLQFNNRVTLDSPVGMGILSCYTF